MTALQPLPQVGDTPLAPAIEARGLCRRFGDKVVLRGLDLQVVPGEVVALLGRNGAGKTTAIRCLLGLLQPNLGGAYLWGREASLVDGPDRARVGYVSEEHRLESGRSVARTLAYEALTNPGFDGDVLTRQLADAGIGLRTRVGKLSRGQRAQLVVRLALARSPDALIFDDPALGLDAIARRELLDEVIGGIADHATAMLLTTHDLGSAERLADRIAILHDGVVALTATTDEVRRGANRWVLRGPLDTAMVAQVPGVLSVKAQPAGGGAAEFYEVCGLNVDGAALAQAAGVSPVGDPVPASLEDVFAAVTTTTASPPAASSREEGSS